MMRELQQSKDLHIIERKESMDTDQPQLSLGPNVGENVSISRKRKQPCDEPSVPFTNIELQLNHPLPLDWEQCLDLKSGRMYYLNRKTLKKSWMKPKERKFDLELNISTFPISEKKYKLENNPQKKQNSMVAVACYNCHLLVMLFKSAPTCPNCKYLNSLSSPTKPATLRQKLETVKSFETLSLLH